MSPLSLLKYSVAFLIKFLGKSADKSFLAMPFTSKLKSLDILSALQNSVVMALPLYLVGVFEDQCSGSFLD